MDFAPLVPILFVFISQYSTWIYKKKYIGDVDAITVKDA